MHRTWKLCNSSINAQNSKLFYYFYSKMLRSGCGSHQCWTKSTIAEQIRKILQFRFHFVNFAHDCQLCAKLCVSKIAEFWHHYLWLNTVWYWMQYRAVLFLFSPIIALIRQIKLLCITSTIKTKSILSTHAHTVTTLCYIYECDHHNSEAVESEANIIRKTCYPRHTYNKHDVKPNYFAEIKLACSTGSQFLYQEV